MIRGIESTFQTLVAPLNKTVSVYNGGYETVMKRFAGIRKNELVVIGSQDDGDGVGIDVLEGYLVTTQIGE